MAAYGAQIKQGKTPAQAEAYLTQLFKHVPVQDKSARDALQTFTGGKGDVLISYENEAITAQQKGKAVDYVIPDQTILIQNPIAVTKSGGSAAKAFVACLHTPAAQKIFAAKGYRPVIGSLVGQVALPDAVRPLHDRRPRRLDARSPRSSSIRRAASWPRSSRAWGCPLQRVESLPLGARPSGRARRHQEAPAADGRHRRAVAEPDRAAAAGRRRGQVAGRRARRVLGLRDEPRGSRGARVHAGRVGGRDRGQRRDGHADRLGAGARRVPRQGRR